VVYIDSLTATGIKLQVRDAAGNIEAQSAIFSAVDGWAEISVVVTADEAATWKFRVCQQDAGDVDFYFSRVFVYGPITEDNRPRVTWEMA